RGHRSDAGLPVAAVVVHYQHDEQQRAPRELLEEVRTAGAEQQHVHAGGEELHADEGDQHTQDGARTAVRVNVAEHGDQDREQDIRRAKVDIGGVCPAQDDDARDGGQHPGDDVADQQDAPVVDTGEPGGGRV